MQHIYNSLSGRKEPLVPLEPGHVRMYVCGITVYDYCHVGHARSLVVFDVVRRYLRAQGYRVTHVRNITDIDDKIIERARQNSEPIAVLTARYTEAMHEDCRALGIESPEHEPRATDYIAEIIRMIGTLQERGFAYVAPDGDVLYAVSRFPGYGRLSGRRLQDLRAGARVEVDEGKRDPLDFVLWKVAKPGEPAWDSPWGPGRPGWHIECSAMAVALLGPHFDLHGGGMDLKFPHHENEIAQSCAACDAPFVNTWMHNGFVRVNDEKMSKSLGNFFTVREVLPLYRHEVLRTFVLASHYRGPITYSDENLRQADAMLERLYVALRGVTPANEVTPGPASERFHAAMSDDFNTPEALAALQGLARDLNVAKQDREFDVAARLAAELRSLGGVLGILTAPAEEWLQSQAASPAVVAGAPARLAAAEIEALILQRTAARTRQEWPESDRLRDLLLEQGVVLEDGPAGTSWRYR
jgi:cysteinyl-tRNA synthetase